MISSIPQALHICPGCENDVACVELFCRACRENHARDAAAGAEQARSVDVARWTTVAVTLGMSLWGVAMVRAARWIAQHWK